MPKRGKKKKGIMKKEVLEGASLAESSGSPACEGAEASSSCEVATGSSAVAKEDHEAAATESK